MAASGAYYNEIDPFAAAWLRQLMAEGLIAAGEVDERSIEDVYPDDLKGFVQCHFFAGIGVWSLALRMAGWPDDREIWTGSCPCQPFSAAGKGGGFDDERHLWPAFHWLIEKRRPVTVLGEQVASADGLHWLDLVSSDLEGSGYAFGALDTCAAGFSAPHIRQRLYWLGHSVGAGLEGYGGDQAARGRNGAKRSAPAPSIPVRLADAMSARRAEWRSGARFGSLAGVCGAGGLADADGRECFGRTIAAGGNDGGGSDAGRAQGDVRAPLCGGNERLADADGKFDDGSGDARAAGRSECPDGGELRWVADASSGQSGNGEIQSGGQHGQFQEDNGNSGDNRAAFHPLNYWGDADWLLCRDPDGPRFRPVEPGAFPLVDAGSVRNRLAAVRGAGNAINLAQAQGFVEAVREVIDAEPGA